MKFIRLVKIETNIAFIIPIETILRVVELEKDEECVIHTTHGDSHVVVNSLDYILEELNKLA